MKNFSKKYYFKFLFIILRIKCLCIKLIILCNIFYMFVNIYVCGLIKIIFFKWFLNLFDREKFIWKCFWKLRKFEVEEGYDLLALKY